MKKKTKTDLKESNDLLDKVILKLQDALDELYGEEFTEDDWDQGWSSGVIFAIKVIREHKYGS